MSPVRCRDLVMTRGYSWPASRAEGAVSGAKARSRRALPHSTGKALSIALVAPSYDAMLVLRRGGIRLKRTSVDGVFLYPLDEDLYRVP